MQGGKGRPMECIRLDVKERGEDNYKERGVD